MTFQKKVFILTEGSRKIGFGHLARCSALAEAFRKKGCLVKLVINGDSAARKFFSDQSSLWFDWIKQKKKLLVEISGGEVVVVDSYLARVSSYREIAAACSLLICLDDNKRLEYPADLVVNAAPNADEFKYSNCASRRMLLGTKYALLRREFWQAPVAKARAKLTKFFLSFGGEDLRNMTPKVLKYLTKNYPQAQKLVICGRGFRHLAAINKTADARTKLFYGPTAREMKHLMEISDVAICAGGQTLFELSRVGLPAAIIGVAENQRRHISSWKKAGFIEVVGWWDTRRLAAGLEHSLSRLEPAKVRQSRAELGQGLVDGQGALRVAEAALERLRNAPVPSLHLRRAAARDCRAIFRLSNDPEVRRNSFQTQAIDWTGHRQWFDGKLHDPTTFFLVAEVEGKFAGQVRFAITNETALVAISLKATYRRRHLGRTLLSQAISLCRRAHPRLKRILAQVKIKNQPSRRLFESVGFSRSRNMTVRGQRAIEYVFKLKDKG